jgi:hypothetical protein
MSVAKYFFSLKWDGIKTGQQEEQSKKKYNEDSYYEIATSLLTAKSQPPVLFLYFVEFSFFNKIRFTCV